MKSSVQGSRQEIVMGAPDPPSDGHRASIGTGTDIPILPELLIFIHPELFPVGGQEEETTAVDHQRRRRRVNDHLRGRGVETTSLNWVVLYSAPGQPISGSSTVTCTCGIRHSEWVKGFQK